MNIEIIVVLLLVAAFYGGIAFLIWRNKKQRATSAERPSEPAEAEPEEEVPIVRRGRRRADP